jgi:hypothetical protein
MKFGELIQDLKCEIMHIGACTQALSLMTDLKTHFVSPIRKESRLKMTAFA